MFSSTGSMPTLIVLLSVACLTDTVDLADAASAVGSLGPFRDQPNRKSTIRPPGTETEAARLTVEGPLASLQTLMGKRLKIGQVRSVGSLNTAGYTVAQWNSLLRSSGGDFGTGPVVALSDEVDEVAIQAFIDRTAASQSAAVEPIVLPTGTFRLTRPLRSGCGPLSVRGAGASATALVQTTPGADAWHHGTPDTRCPKRYSSQFELKDLQLQASGRGGTALLLDMDRSSGGLTLQNVAIRGMGDERENYWHDGLKCNDCSLSFFFDVDLVGRLGDDLRDVGTALSFSGDSASVYEWYAGSINGFDVAVAATSGNGQDLEGFLFDGININNVNIGYKISWSLGMRSPQWFIINGQYGNIGARWIDAAGVGEMEVANNLTYARTPSRHNGGVQGAPTPFVRFDHVVNLVFRDNKEEFGASATQAHNIKNIFEIKDSGQVLIIDNIFAEYGGLMSSAFSDLGGNINLIERDNLFSSWNAQTPKCTGCLSSGTSARWSTYYASKSCDLGSSGLVVCAGSSVGRLNAGQEVKIQLPSPVFHDAPTITASNGDYGALAVACGPVALSVTTIEFVAKCGAAPNHAPVRINWTAVGR